MNYIENYYSNYDEDGRLGYKWGKVEFLTTMRYISKYLERTPEAQVLEIGARNFGFIELRIYVLWTKDNKKERISKQGFIPSRIR